jgi:choline dehydrogenase
VLAARISENKDYSVLLVEAGPDYPDINALPPDIACGLKPTLSHDWGYDGKPVTPGRTIPLPRAKLVGGCAATNATAALRGNPNDYDDWAKCGNPGWTFNEILPFFRRLEKDLDFNNKWHGQDGPLPIRRYTNAEMTSVQHAFMETCAIVGYSSVADHNEPDAVGIGPFPMNTLDGIRQSTALTYLTPARQRPNLTVMGDLLVDKILVKDQKAVGIQVVNPVEQIHGKCIILAAGAYSSPAILMRSGIGPANHLRDIGIDVLTELSGVGQNLIDHPYYGLDFATPSHPKAEELPFGQSVLTLRSSQAKRDHDLHIFPRSKYAVSTDESPTGSMFRIVTSLLKPKSHGQLRLSSANPYAAPLIELGYFSHPDDMLPMIEAVRIARKLAHTSPLSELVAHELIPGPEVDDTDAALEKAIRATVGSYHHPVGTCRMGPGPAEGAVVDAKGCVYGVEGLRVIDASIMPTIPAANINLPIMMIAERCAEWLMESF